MNRQFDYFTREKVLENYPYVIRRINVGTHIDGLGMVVNTNIDYLSGLQFMAERNKISTILNWLKTPGETHIELRANKECSASDLDKQFEKYIQDLKEVKKKEKEKEDK